jgi:hypothetical protein
MNNAPDSRNIEKSVVFTRSIPRAFSELTARDIAWTIVGGALAYLVTLI